MKLSHHLIARTVVGGDKSFGNIRREEEAPECQRGVGTPKYPPKAKLEGVMRAVTHWLWGHHRKWVSSLCGKIFDQALPSP